MLIRSDGTGGSGGAFKHPIVGDTFSHDFPIRGARFSLSITVCTPSFSDLPQAIVLSYLCKSVSRKNVESIIFFETAAGLISVL